MQRAVTAAALVALVHVTPSVGSAQAHELCDRVAAPSGTDRSPGTVTRPLRSAQGLLDALEEGETGCLRDGLYGEDQEIKLEVPGVTLRSYPSERARLRGRLWVTQDAPGSTISGIDIDGRNVRGLPSPTINGDDVRLIDNDITNFNTGICVSLGSPHTFGRASGTLVMGNTIHDCGTLPSTNFDHGIYVNSADDTAILGNRIVSNVDRGIQLYPDAQGTLVAGNVIIGNGEGVLFGGSEETASSGNVVVGNLIADSTIRSNVESSWAGPVGTSNYAVGNCLGEDAAGDIGSPVGFVSVANFSAAETAPPCAARIP